MSKTDTKKIGLIKQQGSTKVKEKIY